MARRCGSKKSPFGSSAVNNLRAAEERVAIANETVEETYLETYTYNEKNGLLNILNGAYVPGQTVTKTKTRTRRRGGL